MFHTSSCFLWVHPSGRKGFILHWGKDRSYLTQIFLYISPWKQGYKCKIVIVKYCILILHRKNTMTVSHWWPSGKSKHLSDMKCNTMIWSSNLEVELGVHSTYFLSCTWTKNTSPEFNPIHLFQISRDNWPSEKVSGSLFSCQVQSLFVRSKLKCTVIQGGFSIVKFIKKVCETI